MISPRLRAQRRDDYPCAHYMEVQVPISDINDLFKLSNRIRTVLEDSKETLILMEKRNALVEAFDVLSDGGRGDAPIIDATAGDDDACEAARAEIANARIALAGIAKVQPTMAASYDEAAEYQLVLDTSASAARVRDASERINEIRDSMEERFKALRDLEAVVVDAAMNQHAEVAKLRRP